MDDQNRKVQAEVNQKSELVVEKTETEWYPFRRIEDILDWRDDWKVSGINLSMADVKEIVDKQTKTGMITKITQEVRMKVGPMYPNTPRHHGINVTTTTKITYEDI